jgi:hypothetical protein
MDNRRRTLNDIITTIFLLNVGTAPTVWYIVCSNLALDQVNNYKNGICCLSAKHAVLVGLLFVFAW